MLILAGRGLGLDSTNRRTLVSKLSKIHESQFYSPTAKNGDLSPRLPIVTLLGYHTKVSVPPP